MCMVEWGEDVIILMDSITRLARAYNITMPTSVKHFQEVLILLHYILLRDSLVLQEILKKAEVLQLLLLLW